MGNDGILSGLRVIDCGTYIAGPASATIMSDFGAEVFKIERPGSGDLFRLFPHLPGTAKSELNWGWVLTSRNKKSVALNLSVPDGREVLLRLVRTADVFVTNYQRVILEQFRLTWDDLRAENPRLIYAHITGYGDSGDDADAPAYDALAYWARSGLMMSVVGNDGTPGRPRPGMGDHPTAMSLFAAIMLGLYRRELTGRGSKVGTSLMASGAWANGCDLQARFCNAVFPESGSGGAKHPPNPLAAGYFSHDGKAFMIALLDPVHEFPRLCEALGHPDLATNSMFADDAGRIENAAALYALLQSQFESRNLAEWRPLFLRHDIKWSAFPLLEEAASDPQMREAGAIIDMEYPGHGRIPTVNSPIFVAGVDKRTPAAAPAIGAHTREVLCQLGYDDQMIEDFLRRGVAATA
ncbi:MAG: CoA transferase [Candidatus Binataceae bacterium]|jgi:formyl-CoA transferase